MQKEFLRDIATLSEEQLNAVRATHLFRFVLMGASSGCGKTRTLVAWCAYQNMLASSVGIPGSRINTALMARDATLVISRFEREVKELLIESGLGEVKGATKLSPHAFHFFDKRLGKIVFWSLYDIEDLRGQEFIAVGIDELTEVPEEAFHAVNWRVRYFGKAPYKASILSATNPDGAYRDWVKAYFVDKTFDTPMGENIKDLKDEFHYIPMTLSANPDEKAREEYRKILMSLPEHLKRARLYADWDTAVGARFPYSFKLVDRLPPVVKEARGLDWGFAKEKFACVWVAKDEENNFYVTKVYKGGNLTLSQAGRLIRELSEGKKMPTFADPTMFSQREPHSLYTLDAYFMKEGVPLIPSTNNHLITNSLIEHLLENGKLFFVRGETEALLRDLTAVRYGEGANPENLIPHEHTDTVYALGYALYGLAPYGVKQPEPKLNYYSSQDLRKLIYAEIKKTHFGEKITRPV
jgi:hypothetical protein